MHNEKILTEALKLIANIKIDDFIEKWREATIKSRNNQYIIELNSLLADEKTARYIDDERSKAIASQVRTRIDILERIAASHTSHDTSFDAGDVEDITAARYD